MGDPEIASEGHTLGRWRSVSPSSSVDGGDLLAFDSPPDEPTESSQNYENSSQMGYLVASNKRSAPFRERVYNSTRPYGLSNSSLMAPDPSRDLSAHLVFPYDRPFTGSRESHKVGRALRPARLRLDDWASSSSDGLPSLPGSPGWQSAKRQVEAEQYSTGFPPVLSPITMCNPLRSSSVPNAALDIPRHSGLLQRAKSFQGVQTLVNQPHGLELWRPSSLQSPHVRWERSGASLSSIHERRLQVPIRQMQRLVLNEKLNRPKILSPNRSTRQGKTNMHFKPSPSLKYDSPPEVLSPLSTTFDPLKYERHFPSHCRSNLYRRRQSFACEARKSDFESNEEMISSERSSQPFSDRENTSFTSDRQSLIELFEVGDRIGPGLFHDGELIRAVKSSEETPDQGIDYPANQLEVVQLLGTGSYAVVYLVREILPDTGGSHTTTTPRAHSTLEENVPTTNDQNLQTPNTALAAGPTPSPRSYALKCLTKRNLLPDQLHFQKFEVELHQSIPAHPHIVTLHCAYETSDWLFLVLEYCPGKDLYYWLEEARTAQLESPTANSMTPSLLSQSSPTTILSSARLHVVSDIFIQMCEAVQFCHDHGISHRDIKPENFIMESVQDQDGLKFIVKLTDFGLATYRSKCNDFNCGTKPYMAFECRHNLTKQYDPKQADVWSLGIVLLNLIYHRSPFKEPSVQHCSSFAAFSCMPIAFLMQAFSGMTEEFARFLCDNVLCDVSSGRCRRISPHEFGRWASNLPDILAPKNRQAINAFSFSNVSLGLPVAQDKIVVNESVAKGSSLDSQAT